MKYLLLGLAGLLFLSACGTQTSTKTGQTASARPATAASAPAPSQVPAVRFFAPGDQIVVESGQSKVLLTVNQPGVLKPGQYDSAASKGEYLGVPITIENQGAQPFTVSSLIGFEVRDQDGQGYSTAFLSSAPRAPDGEVAPTQKLAGTLVYDVAPGKAYQLLFKVDFLGSGQTIVRLGNF